MTGVKGCTIKHWTPDELALLRSIIEARPLSVRDANMFPGRTWDGVHGQAAKLRKRYNLGTGGLGRPRKIGDAITWVQDYDSFVKDAINGSNRLLIATVRMAVRNNSTLPGMSPAHTIALARNLGVIDALAA